MAKEKKQREDNRDIFDKVFDETGVLVPAALMAGGAVVGRRLGRRSAQREWGEQYGGIRKGEDIIDDYGNVRPATDKDVAFFDRVYRGKVRSGGFAGGLAGATAGSAAGLPILDAGMKKKRRK